MADITMSNVTMADVLKAELKSAETLTCMKYPNLAIVVGSMIQEVQHPVYGNKRRVQVVCKCGVRVERATSDLHTFIGCVGCKKVIRKGNKTAKKIEQLAAAAAAAEVVAAAAEVAAATE